MREAKRALKKAAALGAHLTLCAHMYVSHLMKNALSFGTGIFPEYGSSLSNCSLLKKKEGKFPVRLSTLLRHLQNEGKKKKEKRFRRIIRN